MSDTSAVDIDFEGNAAENPDEDLGVLSAVRLAAEGAPPGGVLGARDIARGRWSPGARGSSESLPQTREELADLIADEIAAGEKMAELATKYRPRFEAFGLIHHDSQPETMLRRLQEFRRKYIDDRRIAVDQLPERMQRGRETGGQRRPETPLLELRAQVDGTRSSEQDDTVQ